MLLLNFSVMYNLFKNLLKCSLYDRNTQRRVLNTAVLDYVSIMLYFMHGYFLKKSDLLWEAYLSFFLTHSGGQKAAQIRMDGSRWEVAFGGGLMTEVACSGKPHFSF